MTGAEESKGADVAAPAVTDAAAATTVPGASAVVGMLEPVKSADDAKKDAAAMLHRKRLCENHDDGSTEAAWACVGCVDLRAEDAAAPVLPEGKTLTDDEVAAHTGLSMCDQVWCCRIVARRRS
jgi:hypothetical protein